MSAHINPPCFGTQLLKGALATGALVGLFAAGTSHARPWKGIQPGITRSGEVVRTLGTPSQQVKNRGKCATLLNYQGRQKRRGTTQVNVCVGADDIVRQIDVFPARSLRKEDVPDYFGDDFQKRLTDDFFEYYHYRADGFIVFFDEGGDRVLSLRYTKPKPKMVPKPGKSTTPRTAPPRSAKARTGKRGAP